MALQLDDCSIGTSFNALQVEDGSVSAVATLLSAQVLRRLSA